MENKVDLINNFHSSSCCSWGWFMHTLDWHISSENATKAGHIYVTFTIHCKKNTGSWSASLKQ